MNKAKWYDIFTDQNGNPCAAKIGGWIVLITGIVLLVVNNPNALAAIGIGLGALGVGKGLDAVIPKDPAGQ